MSELNNTDMDFLGEGFCSPQANPQQPIWLQGAADFMADKPVPFLDAPFMQESMHTQQGGWASPSTVQPGEVLHDDSGEALLSASPAAKDLPASPPLVDLATENARLKDLIMALNERIVQLESDQTPTTSPQQLLTRLPTTPRRRPASSLNKSPSSTNRAVPTTPQSAGPIAAMWSPGVTPEQRRAIYKLASKSAAPPAVYTASSDSLTDHQNSASSPAAMSTTPSTHRRKSAGGPVRASRVKKMTRRPLLTPKTRNPVQELSEANFGSSTADDEGDALTPRFAGFPFAAPPTFNTATPTVVDMTAAEINALAEYTVGRYHVSDFGSANAVETIDDTEG
ncbi:hypothetical protein ACEQ8H_000455 [Pleosporales sp. CAS-2024a]